VNNVSHAHSVEEQIAPLLDPGSAKPFPADGAEQVGALRVFAGAAGARAVVVAALEPGTARGAIGVPEADALARLFVALSANRTPLVLALSSVHESTRLEVLAARRLLTLR
jgi:hypothetical protein